MRSGRDNRKKYNLMKAKSAWKYRPGQLVNQGKRRRDGIANSMWCPHERTICEKASIWNQRLGILCTDNTLAPFRISKEHITSFCNSNKSQT